MVNSSGSDNIKVDPRLSRRAVFTYLDKKVQLKAKSSIPPTSFWLPHVIYLYLAIIWFTNKKNGNY